MLYFVSKELALGYLLFCFVSALGLLQCVAQRYRLVGLGFLTDSEKHARGYGLGALLMGGGALLFFVGQWDAIFAPGLAGAELCLLFGTGTLCALAATFLIASVQQRLRTSPLRDRNGEGQLVAVGSAAGRLYGPHSPSEPVPAVCLVARPGAAADSMNALARSMVAEGMVALVIDADRELCSYPGILALLPAATSLLSKRPEVDPQRLGALGHDLGGDLVIRAASVDNEIKAIAALAPVLLEPPVGLDLLREMSYAQALQWSHDRRRVKLRTDLDALKFVAKIAPRPLLLIYGAEDRLVTMPPLDQPDAHDADSIHSEVIPGSRHLDVVRQPMAIRTAVQWFKAHL